MPAIAETTDPGGRTTLQAGIAHKLLPILGTAWAVLVMAGLCALWTYASAPGEQGRAPTVWPSDSLIARGERPTLLMFAHPMCPCTRASLAELERLLARCGDQAPDTHVLFIAPEGTESEWRKSDLRQRASRIPGVNVHDDFQRRESLRFAAKTSGACLLYDAGGKLIFQGGLTAARGHEGDNSGSDSIASLLAGDASPQDTSPVFGCCLFEDEATSGAGKTSNPSSVEDHDERE